MIEQQSVVIGNDAVPSVNDGVLTVYPILGLPESPEMSIALIRLNGENDEVKNSGTDATYYIISGVGYFTVWSGSYPETTIVRSGDMITIPRGINYKDVGADLVMIGINHPAFDPGGVRVLEKNR